MKQNGPGQRSVQLGAAASTPQEQGSSTGCYQQGANAHDGQHRKTGTLTKASRLLPVVEQV
jgi:hypothetical protein